MTNTADLAVAASSTRTAARSRRRHRPQPAALLVGVLGLALAFLGISPAQAAPSGWADFTFDGSSRAFSGTMAQAAAGFPEATYVTDSVGGAVGVQSGATTFLPPQTPVAAKYGSSQGEKYLNLRPNNQSGPPPSVTTYTFERPTPSSGWTFVLGDIDADRVQISATGIGGRPVAAADLGFRSAFNYCAPGVSPKPGCAPPNNSGLDLPTWDPATATLDGSPTNLDTAGSSAWFEPTIPLTTLTFTFARDAGFPVYQTWFSALAYDLTGTVTAPAGERGGITMELYDGQGTKITETQTAADGTYRFPGFATHDDYQVVLVRPPGLTSDQPLTRSVDLSAGDAQADFTLRAIVPVDVSGTVRDDNKNPVGGITITLTDAEGTEVATATTNADGSYTFDDVPSGTDYTLTATPPDDATVSEPLTFSVPADSETPVTGQDFTVTPAPTGSLSGTVTEQGDGPRSGVLITITGEGGTYTVRTRADGTWTLGGLPLGDYTVTITAPDGTTVIGDEEVDVTLNPQNLEDTADFVVEVPAPATHTASGTVTDTDDAPVPDVDVVVTDPTTGDETTATTDDDGAWSVPDLDPAADYTAEVQVPDGYQPSGDTTITFDIDDVDVTDLDFVLAAEVAESPSPTTSPTATEPPPTSTAPTTEPRGPGSLADTGGPRPFVGLLGIVLIAGGAVAFSTGRARRRRVPQP